MDIIDVFFASHAALRARFEALAAPFSPSHGVGWDDRMALDCKSLLKDISSLSAAYARHAALEDELFAKIGRFALDEDSRAALADGRRSVMDLMKLFGAVAFSCDGEHVHRVREMLFRVRDALGAHLSYEEKVLFPMLRQVLPDAQWE